MENGAKLVAEAMDAAEEAVCVISATTGPVTPQEERRRLRLFRRRRETDSRRATAVALKRLAIPPAWTDIWICPTPNCHIQATGRDARRRKQYLYHERWREVRDESNTIA
jgi:DNA topoisomerase-1